MSSIRLFILSSFEAFGPMHGHLLRAMAEKMQVPLWTDISVGAVYGAMNRLAAEGLLKEAGREQEGNRPTRQLYAITAEGRAAVIELRREGLSDIWFKPDPFDLAFAWMDPKTLKAFPATIAARLEKVRAMLADARARVEEHRAQMPLTKQWALRHTEYRLEAEAAYLTDLLKAAKDIVAEKHKPLALPKADPKAR